MSDIDQRIEQHFQTLLTGMGNSHVATLELTEQVTQLRSQYEAARETAKTGTDEQKQDFGAYQTALAGGLPGITQGTLTAITAFQTGDAIGGSAAVMDICSSLASILGGLSTAGGPPGALIGALFSMVSMILNFFGPKPPDMVDKIEKLLRDLSAEEKKSMIKAAGDGVEVYEKGCAFFMTPEEGGGVRNPEELTIELRKVNLVKDNIIMDIRLVQGWLEEVGNQGLDGWPEILNLHCEVYMRLMLAVTRQNLYAHDAETIKRYVGDPKAFPEKVTQWKDLQNEAQVKFTNLASNNEITSRFLRGIVPVARQRGVFIASYGSSGVWTGTGPKLFQDKNSWKQIVERCHRVSITQPKEGTNNPAAQFDLWSLGTFGNSSQHNKFDTKRLVTTKGVGDVVGPNDGNLSKTLTDWWPVPRAGDVFEVYGALFWKDGGALTSFNWNSVKNTLDRAGWEPVTAQKMVQVRVAAPLAVLPDDPDAPAIPADKLNRRGDQYGQLIYGALENSPDIYVWHGPGDARVASPMHTYSGVAVDPYFLWVYGDQGFACATHASVMGCIEKKRPAPRWFPHHPSNIASVRDLSPCEDNTLFVSTSDRLSTGVFSLDLTTHGKSDDQRLTVKDWEDFPGQANADQVQKLPIYGWQLLERSVAAVAQPA